MTGERLSEIRQMIDDRSKVEDDKYIEIDNGWIDG